MAVKTKIAPVQMFTVRELADELGLVNKVVIEKANELGIEDIKSYASKLTAGQCDRLRAKLGGLKKQKEEQEKSDAVAQASATSNANVVSKPLDPSAPRYGVVVPAPGQSLQTSAKATTGQSESTVKSVKVSSSITKNSGIKPGTIIRMPDSHRPPVRRSQASTEPAAHGSLEGGWTTKAAHSTPPTAIKHRVEPSAAPAAKETVAAPHAHVHVHRAHAKTERDLEKERFEQSKKKNRKKDPNYREELKKRKEEKEMTAEPETLSEQRHETPKVDAAPSPAGALETARETKAASKEKPGVLSRLIRKVFGS